MDDIARNKFGEAGAFSLRKNSNYALFRKNENWLINAKSHYNFLTFGIL